MSAPIACGMMFFSMTSLYSGAGGRSRPRLRKGTRSTTSRSCPVAGSGVAALPENRTAYRCQPRFCIMHISEQAECFKAAGGLLASSMRACCGCAAVFNGSDHGLLQTFNILCESQCRGDWGPPDTPRGGASRSAPVPASVVTSSSPWKQRVTMDGRLRLPPVRSACSTLSNHDANSTGSLCLAAAGRQVAYTPPDVSHVLPEIPLPCKA